MQHLGGQPANRITEVTRRNILDALLLRDGDFCGRLDQVTFLGRIWPLASMQSTDRREPNLDADLRRHIGWGDYDDGEVLYGKLNIGHCADAEFARFLAECVHPLVRSNPAEVAELLDLFNEHLALDGFAVVETGRVSNHPVYGMVELGAAGIVGAQGYDVALSFAGEERGYVDEVARLLREQNVSVFYDRFEEANLWGRDLTEAFDQVFLHARFVVVFISAAYGAKVWPTYERRAAVEAAMMRNEAVILPVRFDDTQVPGIRNTLAYIDGRQRSPQELVELILRRLGRRDA